MDDLIQVIDKKIKEGNNEYHIFIDIYKNYKKYNFLSYDECKNSLISLFDIAYNFLIDTEKIEQLLKITSKNINRDPQTIFRK